jgi:hypothetical protein
MAWAHRWLYEDFWCLIWPNAGAMLHKHHQAHLAELGHREGKQ